MGGGDNTVTAQRLPVGSGAERLNKGRGLSAAPTDGAFFTETPSAMAATPALRRLFRDKSTYRSTVFDDSARATASAPEIDRLHGQ